MSSLRLLFLLLFGLLPWVPSGLTAQPLRSLSDEQALARWTVSEGAPADIWTLRYATDGKLWLGTGVGLFRFDGVKFERYALRAGERLPAANINALLLGKDGEIWLGFNSGGVARLKDGRVQAYGRAQGVPSGRVLRLAYTSDGVLWAAAGAGLARFDGRQWRRVGPQDGFPDDEGYYVFVDSRGTLWVCGASTLAYRPAGSTSFTRSPRRISRDAVLSEDLQGRVWLSELQGGTRPVTDRRGHELPLGEDEAHAVARTVAKQMLFARDGSLWLTSVQGGLLRVPDASALADGQRVELGLPGLQQFTTREGLMSDASVPLAEDAEGGVWVGTNFGLGGFRPRRLHAVPELAITGFGGYLITGFGQGVLAGGGGGLKVVDPPGAAVEFPGNGYVRPLAQASSGEAWVAEGSGLVLASLQGRRKLPVPLAGVGRVLAAASDGSGGVWVSLFEAGVWHVGADRQVTRLTNEPRDRGEVQLISPADDGSLWVGAGDRLYRYLPDGRWVRFGREEGLQLGYLSAVLATRDEVFVAGHGGFARRIHGGFAQVDAEQDDAFGSITGIVRDEAGDLWLNGGRGIVHLTRAALDRLDSPGLHSMDRLVLDSRDGLPGIAIQAGGGGTAVRDRRGRLWFATNRGVAWLEPRSLRLNLRPPTVEILTLRSGDTVFKPEPGLTLPSSTRSLIVRFTAQTLATSDRARFRYRLEGADNRWQDLGGQRELLIANLGPGRYRLHLMAANGDGIWGEPGLAYEFSVTPKIWQTWPFVSACVLSLGLLIAAIYRLRTRALERRVALRLEERHAERERIARELHDTLMQGLQGLLLSFHVAASSVLDGRLRAQLERALRRAEALITEGRDRVWALRVGVDGDLYGSLGLMAHELLEDHARLELRQVGEPRALDPLARDALLCIGREAILNAVRHASGLRCLDISLGYAPQGCWLSVRDDGLGMDPRWQQAGARPHHFGLTGMRERALQLDGRLEIHSIPGRGTEIRVELPAHRAFSDPIDRRRGRWAALWRPLWPWRRRS